MDAKVHNLFVFYKVDKEKVSDWLLRLPYEGERTDNNPKLDSAAKIIKDFQKPRVKGKIISVSNANRKRKPS